LRSRRSGYRSGNLVWIIKNPAGIDPALVDLARRLLANETLFAKLDSASDETDFLNGDFGGASALSGVDGVE